MIDLFRIHLRPHAREKGFSMEQLTFARPGSLLYIKYFADVISPNFLIRRIQSWVERVLLSHHDHLGYHLDHNHIPKSGSTFFDILEPTQ
jgi:hypothetical protein